eukprot:CAMPEP_0115569608 /NCGR_PEP_ID=MMETSP0271-20121206/105277_1 /TAXON_ID=71861 /ORGANISM="Scrippsiella trochoidea, Strain CCMP3099" /LENGTH=116 /DNA_ID=CAMNT_0003004131 /DNA_START=37 /DNA_END=388 /DNA_ORIENTATION=+
MTTPHIALARAALKGPSSGVLPTSSAALCWFNANRQIQKTMEAAQALCLSLPLQLQSVPKSATSSRTGGPKSAKRKSAQPGRGGSPARNMMRHAWAAAAWPYYAEALGQYDKFPGA